MSGAISEFAPAKVNLTLHVLGRRPDGYHELSSLVAFADVGDRIEIEPAPVWSLSVAGPMAGSIEGPNIADRAAAAYAAALPGATLGSARLWKELPVYGGIGGGSANAAAVLRALARINAGRPGADAIDLAALALGLGADVPVCLASRLSHMTGIGERVRPLDYDAMLPAVLVNPRAKTPTADVFRLLAAAPLRRSGQAFARPDAPSTEPSGLAKGSTRPTDIDEAIRLGRNDLEAPATRTRSRDRPRAERTPENRRHHERPDVRQRCDVLWVVCVDAGRRERSIAHRAHPPRLVGTSDGPWMTAHSQRETDLNPPLRS